MKRYCSDFEFTEEFIEECVLECLSHTTNKRVRWYRKDTAYFLADYFIKDEHTDNQNIDEVADFIYRDIQDNVGMYRTLIVPVIVKEMLAEILEERIDLKPIIYQERYDSSSLKKRKIGISSIKQQVYDYIAVNACKKMFSSKIGTYQCSSLKNRGQNYAKKHIEKCVRKKHKHARYWIKADVKKYYPSIKHEKLFKFLKRDIENKHIIYLLTTLVSSYSANGVGLCIGTYLSQYLANYYLSYLYHYIEQNCFTERKDRKTKQVKKVRLYYKMFFYMDDMLICGSNKKHLKKAMKMIIKYMDSELGLELKHNQYLFIDIFREGAFIDIVGFRIYKDHTTIRKRVYKRIVSATNAMEHSLVPDKNVAKSVVSRHGYIKYSDSIHLRKKLNYDHAYNLAREVIKNEARGIVQPSPTTNTLSGV